MPPSDPNEDAVRRERRLSGYEGRLEVVSRRQLSVGGEAGMLECHAPFGPLIGRVRLPDPLVDRVNAHVDELVARQPAEANRSGELGLSEEFVSAGGEASLASETARLLAAYVAESGEASIRELRFELFWVVRQFAETYSPMHFHSGELSGVLYLEVPACIREAPEHGERSYISARQSGFLTFVTGGKQRLSKSLVSFRPAVGDLYLFPGWLLHGAEPFHGEGERRSLAFNAFVNLRA